VATKLLEENHRKSKVPQKSQNASFGSTRSQVRILSPRLNSQGLAFQGAPKTRPNGIAGSLSWPTCSTRAAHPPQLTPPAVDSLHRWGGTARLHPRRAADAAVPASDFCGANRQGSEPLPWRIVHRLMAGCRHWRHLRAENHLIVTRFPQL
jgi:hypothetical protein